jgi:hypothetical protein
MGEIRSALEIAMEKLKELDEATDDERLRWKYVPQGEKLAASYLKQDCNLIAELGKYEQDVAGYMAEGAGSVLIRNINLPRHELAKRNNRRAMEGIKILKSDKVGVENIYSQIRQVFSHYAKQGAQQRKQAYESLKTEFEAKVKQAIQQQFGSTSGIKIDIENQPQFQAEWSKMQSQLDSQYLKLLNEYKQELLNIP